MVSSWRFASLSAFLVAISLLWVSSLASRTVHATDCISEEEKRIRINFLYASKPSMYFINAPDLVELFEEVFSSQTIQKLEFSKTQQYIEPEEISFM